MGGGVAKAVGNAITEKSRCILGSKGVLETGRAEMQNYNLAWFTVDSY